MDLTAVFLEPDASAAIGFVQNGADAVPKTVQAKLREWVSVDDFRLATDSDDTAAFARAFAVSGLVRAPGSTYEISDTIVIPAYGILCGGGVSGTVITISVDQPAIVLITWSQLRDLTVTKSDTHTTNLVEVGSATLDGGRATISNVWVEGAGQDGVQIIHGNLGRICNLTAVSNGRDGLNFAEVSGDANSWVSEGFNDLRNNGRDGLHVGAHEDVYNSKSNMLRGIVTQSNGRYGTYCNTRSNLIDVYSEFNTSDDIVLDELARGNIISPVQGNVTDNSANPEFNIVWSFNASGGYQRISQNRLMLSGMSAAGWQIFNDDGAPGTLRAYKLGDKHYAIATDNSGGLHTVSFAADDGPTNWDFEGNVYPQSDDTYIFGGSGQRWAGGAFTELTVGTSAKILTSIASPEGVVTASPGSICTNENGGSGTTLYVKRSGTGNTGWFAVA